MWIFLFSYSWVEKYQFTWRTLGTVAVSHISAQLASSSTSINHLTVCNRDFEEEKWNIVYETCLSAWYNPHMHLYSFQFQLQWGPGTISAARWLRQGQSIKQNTRCVMLVTWLGIKNKVVITSPKRTIRTIKELMHTSKHSLATRRKLLHKAWLTSHWWSEEVYKSALTASISSTTALHLHFSRPGELDLLHSLYE